MTRWNPKSYLNEGRGHGFQEDYLKELIKAGRVITNKNVPVIFSLSHLANLSDTLYKDLHAFVSRPTEDAQGLVYKSFPIRKRSGGKRWISIPCEQLMAVQDFIAQEVLNNIKPHSAAMAYVPGLNNPLKANAEKHMHAKWILKMDIQSFFSNISERQVYDVFKSLGYPNLLSFEMARLCTRITPKRKGDRWNSEIDFSKNQSYQCSKIGSLPQGAPTSSALSNLVCFEMDQELESLAHVHGADYSRYADDLCFSFLDANRQSVYEFKRQASKVLYKNHFRENRKKTRIIPPGSRKIITGVVIDSGKTTIPRELRDRIRMHLYYCKKVGIPEHCKQKGFRSVLGFRNHLYGLIMYVRSINEVQGDSFLQEFNKLPWLDFNI
ncbi:reverse transcriptase family protein [Porticoccaceae bacterium LTM1]|nr:reverse transcriptase family protein [Porticoccaceae bacterium LTM1]